MRGSVSEGLPLGGCEVYEGDSKATPSPANHDLGGRLFRESVLEDSLLGESVLHGVLRSYLPSPPATT